MPVARLASSLVAALLASTALVGIAPARAQGLPTGGRVVSGGVTIGTPANGALAITQSSQSAIVNWQGFSIGQGNRVDIRQPDAQAAILNRVTGSTPSTIAGQLNANGQVYLVNPNGITITQSGRVDAGGGFVASTLGISDDDFKAGRRQFRGSGASAKVTNHGTITVGRGGYAALIGGRVSNTGLIAVPMGKVGLGSGERATLDLSGDGFLQVQVPTDAKGRGALVSNSGTISADGGSVVLTAAAARDMARRAVNLSGTIEARSVSGRNGSITLSGGEGSVVVGATARLDASGRTGENGGRVRVTGRQLDVAGRIDASGARGGRVGLRASEKADLSGLVLVQGTTGPGGRVTATAPDLSLHSALIDASGATGGGTVRLGGGRQGSGALTHARMVEVDAGTMIRADATRSGHGGDVVLWSDVATRFFGTISARGGAAGGNGGEAEVSSKGVLTYAGLADLTAARGHLGTLLLDPYNITISSGTDTNQTEFTATGNDSVINSTTLLTALGGANVTVSTGTGGSQAGTITLAAATPLSWNTGATLTLQAAGAVTLNSSVTAAAGGLTIAAGTGTSTATADISVARFTLASGDWAQNAATLPVFTAGDFRVADGASFLRAAGGTGTSADPYRLADTYGVQGMGTASGAVNARAASYRLAGDLDAAGTASWNGGLGFSPVGTDGAAFSGSLDGAGYAISGLTIARPSQNHVGLFGYVAASATVSNIGIVGGSVTGRYFVGGLAGRNDGTVSQAYATGSVVSTLSDAGGLAGANVGTIRQSYAAGSVSGVDSVGGLAGSNVGGTVSQAYATGSVSGRNNVGGLVGYGDGNSSVSQAYATGSVTGTGTGVGGLLGYYDGGPLSATYWDTQTTGQSNATGSGAVAGATGLTSAQGRSQAGYINANDSSQNFDFGSVWYQAGDLRPILRSEAASADANGVIAVSNLHQLQLMGANLAGSYRLTANLDAGATSSTEASPGLFGAGGFVPVGSSSNMFNGSLDGTGHTTSGLTIYAPSTDYVGLIGMLDRGGTVQNLGFVDGSVTGRSSVGGLVGLSWGMITRAYATGTVRGSNDHVGGLVGFNRGTITQAYATGAVTGSNDYVGGLVGTSYGTITQTYATGRVTGSGSNVGGLVGSNGGALSATYWDTGTTGQSNATGGGAVAGATGLTSAQARSQAGYTNGSDSSQNFDFGSVWYQAGDLRPMLRSEAATADANGVIAVSNLHQLQLMGANLLGSYRLTANIDASATTSTEASPGVFGAGGFVPVGTGGNGFTGSLDGAGRTVSGLTINRPSESTIGLIGFLDGGSVSRLGLVGSSITGGFTDIGGMIGLIRYGRVDQVSAGGTVASTIGGGGGGSVGGLSGGNVGGTITRSFATGSVTSPGDYVGGLVGYNTGTISQSYAAGSVTGNSYSVGGLIGHSDGTVSQVYATGRVGGTAGAAGGLIGEAGGVMLSAAYWNTETTNQANAIGNWGGVAGTAGRTTAQMQDLAAFQTNYAGFDFTNGWTPPNQAGQGGQGTAYYPQLASLSRVLTVTPTTSRAYGDANPGLIASYSGVRPGDFVTTLGSLTTGATATSDVGTYAATASGSAVTGSNYRVLYLPGSLTISPRRVTVMADPQGRLYGDANAPLTFTTTSLGAGAALSGTLVTAATATSDVGSYAITQGSLTAANPNYALTYAGANLTVDQRPVTVTANAQSRLYGDANPSLTFAATSLGAGAALSGSLATAATATSDTGSYAIAQGTLTAAANPNYAISYTGANLTVAQRPVTVTANAQSRLYGDANPALTYQVGGRGLVNGDTLTGGLGTTADARSAVGTYAIGQGSLAASSNYAVSYVGAGLAVTARPLTLTADAQSRIYGDANPALTYQVGGRGLVNGDTLTGALATAASTSSNVGTYAIGQGNLAASGNYAVSYVGADLAVTARPLTLTADAQSRVYGDANPALTYQVGGRGLVNGDALTGALATAASTSSNVGTYAIGQGTLAASSNYAVSYVGADLAVTARPLTLAADAQSRVYGDANPALTYQVGGRGLVNGDALTGALATAASTSSNVGTYAIGQGTLAASSNYAVSYVGADLAVTARPLTLTADAQSRIYGDANPALTYQVGGRGLVNGDALTGGLGTTADARSAVGTYAIGQGNLAASGNYAVSYVGADLAVTARPLTLTADAQSRIYGDANPALTYQVGGRGLVNGDALTGALATAASTSSNVGTYAIGQGTLAASSNYAVSYVGADLAVTARPLTLTADAQSRIYGDANPALTYQVGGRGLVNGDALTGGLGTTADARSAVGTYAIGQGNLAASGNYAVSYVGADLAVTARPLTLTADAQSRIYGDANPALTYQVGGRGLVNGDALTGALATAASTSSNVGTYAIGQGTLAASSNYAVSYVGADLAVTARPLTLTADGQSRVYGDANPALTYQVGGRGLVNGDTLTGGLSITADARSSVGTYAIGQGSLAASSNYAVSYVGADLAVTARPIALTADAQSRIYGDANPALTYQVGGRGLANGDTLTGALATAASTSSNVGTYAIGQGTLAASSNYAVSYVGADLAVTARPLTLTADAQSRIYGDANPALTYQVGGRGLVNGDALTGALATAASTSSNVGTYAIGQGTLAASSNYAVSYVGADLAVTARPLTLTADGQSRVYGDANPALTYQVGGRGLVNGDGLSGALATTADADSLPGRYTINQGSLTIAANYSLTYFGADITITPRPASLIQAAVALPTTSLASTVQRVSTVTQTPAVQPVEPAPGLVQTSSQTITDPRFDKTVVCLMAGGCFIVPPLTPPAAQLGSAIRPQASAATPSP
ncbi:filamentous hemagglutinin N-terminal domain-containing protein [Methylobacterium currus]|uniref:MBG domain-containing protein n=1 Tax=Methylobacterium currus TaxID=2051553 RepID=UPI001E4F0B85|nr:MBG domain-containing protein [Methylobacterium currus]UHC17159.1 filamentous hemagglutinin N-terminal domain-containing protein [Methylobacterium currus]